MFISEICYIIYKLLPSVRCERSFYSFYFQVVTTQPLSPQNVWTQGSIVGQMLLAGQGLNWLIIAENWTELNWSIVDYVQTSE